MGNNLVVKFENMPTVMRVFIITLVFTTIISGVALSASLGGSNGIKVKAKTINVGNLVKTIKVTSEVTLKERKKIFLPSNQPGIVSKIYVKVGDVVKKDDKLVDINYQNANGGGQITESVKSPLEGTILEVALKENSQVDNKFSAFKISKSKVLCVNAMVKDTNIRDIKVGQLARLSSSELNKGEYIAGKVSEISNVVNEAQNGEDITFDVGITLDDKNQVLKFGTTMDCEIKIGEKNNVLTGVVDMISEDTNNKTSVFVVDKKTSKISKRNIQLGMIADFSFEIINGIQMGEVVVMDPNPTLKDGDLVTITQQLK